jgi:nitrite reductase/ring-hydroxylating ferredoxin subunit
MIGCVNMDDKTVSQEANLICARADLKDGGMAARFQYEFDGQSVAAIAIAFDNEVHGYVNSCPHRATELDWQPGQVFDESGLYLVCATHGALFEADTGRCVGGPCQGASLLRVALTVTGDSIFLARGRLLSAQVPTPALGEKT